MRDRIIAKTEKDRETIIGYLMRDSHKAFSGYLDQDKNSVFVIDRDDTENLILKGVKFRYVSITNDKARDTL